LFGEPAVLKAWRPNDRGPPLLLLLRRSPGSA
jgi:hypothetical protein